MLEIILGTHSKSEAIDKVFGYLKNTIPPIVCSLHILHIVNTIVCYNLGRLKFVNIVPLPVPNQAMAAITQHCLLPTLHYVTTNSKDPIYTNIDRGIVSLKLSTKAFKCWRERGWGKEKHTFMKIQYNKLMQMKIFKQNKSIQTTLDHSHWLLCHY